VDIVLSLLEEREAQESKQNLDEIDEFMSEEEAVKVRKGVL
jgi:hypothetical protein